MNDQWWFALAVIGGSAIFWGLVWTVAKQGMQRDFQELDEGLDRLQAKIAQLTRERDELLERQTESRERAELARLRAKYPEG